MAIAIPIKIKNTMDKAKIIEIINKINKNMIIKWEKMIFITNLIIQENLGLDFLVGAHHH